MRTTFRSLAIATVSAQVLGAGCLMGDGGPQGQDGVSLRSLHVSPSASGDSEASFVGLSLYATDQHGVALPCDDKRIQVEVSITFDGRKERKIKGQDVVVRCSENAPRDVALVLDNSGSQEQVLEETRRGAGRMADAVLAAGGRVSVVRVSTAAVVLNELTSEREAIAAQLDGMFVNRGWTSLYDGIRLGNETLGAGSYDERYFDDQATFCAGRRERAIVVFTNGVDNNSSDELEGTESDGLDTRPQDLANLKVKGVTTPVFSIGLGKEVDNATLDDLARRTGGKHLRVESPEDLATAFEQIAEYAPRTAEVCAELPAYGCGPATLEVQYKVDHEKNRSAAATETFRVNVSCPAPKAQGRSATILLALSNPGIAPETAGKLAENTARYVAGLDEPRVLVIRDDNHHDENAGDPGFIHDLLVARGLEADLIDEPVDGVVAEQLGDYDVAWFSNPGWPMDDQASFDALRTFLGQGRGVVLSGDDMSWSMGKAFSMSPLTHLEHLDNGVTTCGRRTDNDAASKYAVEFASTTHPAIAGLEKARFTYGDDMDHTEAKGEGEQVLAYATLADDKKCKVRIPVIVVHEPK